MNREQKQWNPNSWLRHPAQQIPVYPDEQEFKKVVEQLEHRPPLVHHSEIEKLKSLIGAAGQGHRFLLQAGECAERFIDCQSEVISEKLKILMQMSLMAAYGLRRPVVSIGRLAGQFGKPRSDDLETREGLTLPSYRGDIINGFEFSPAARRPDPHRMLDAYQCACATLNWMRALGESGWSDISSLKRWSLHKESTSASQIFEDIKERLEDALAIIDVWSRDRVGSFQTDRHPVFTSHEALLLPYEAALTRFVDESAAWFNQGAHFLWLGERTRDLNGAHVEYLSGIANPVGIKVGPSTSPAELVALVRRLNPTNEWGRITLISRLGAAKVGDFLPALIDAIRKENLKVTWSCDPMHGNIVRMSDGLKTRYFDNIMSEVLVSQHIHHENGSWLGGLHLEITAEDVTECVGGDVGVQENHLNLNYQSYCDPRLNYGQSLELMLRFCDAFKKLAHREVGSAVGSIQSRSNEFSVEEYLG